MSPSMETHRPQSQEVNLARVDTAFNADTVCEVKEQLFPLLTRSGHVVLDLHRAAVDSVGLGALLSLQRRLELQGRGLFLVSDRSDFRRLLEAAGVSHAFSLHTNVDQALRLAGEIEQLPTLC